MNENQNKHVSQGPPHWTMSDEGQESAQEQETEGRPKRTLSKDSEFDPDAPQIQSPELFDQSSQPSKVMKLSDTSVPDPGKQCQTRRFVSELLDVSPQVLQVLQRMNIKSLLDLWARTKVELHSAGLSSEQTEDLLRKAAEVSCGSLLSKTGLSTKRLAFSSTLTFGCPVLDAFFGKGCPTDQMVEFSGEAGSGKTQVCLQLALTTQLAKEKGGLKGDCLYIFTESGFPSRRLKQMTDTVSTSPFWAGVVMDRIFVEQLDTFGVLEAFLSIKVHELFRMKPIRLIVIDSVASVFRYEETELVSPKLRAERIQSLGQLLKDLQRQYSVAVVCANQVTDVVKEPQSLTQYSKSNLVIPALGISWSNFVTTRVMLAKTYDTGPYDQGTHVRRRMRILFSPILPISDVELEVWNGGIRGVADPLASQPI